MLAGAQSQLVLAPLSHRDHRASSTGGELGQSLVGLILVVLILGGMAAVVLGSQGGSGGTHGSAATTLPGGLTASPGGAGTDIAAAAAIACRTDYEAVTQAVSYYQTLNVRPPAGMADLRTFFKDPVTSSYFTISIDAHKPGVVAVATPGHPAEPGDANCAQAG